MADALSVAAPQLRAAALEQAFREIGRTRMQGMPMLHPGLRVEALGFAPLVDAEPDPERDPRSDPKTDAKADSKSGSEVGSKADSNADSKIDPVSRAGSGAECGAGRAALGILITPWFMNLILLPLDDAPALPVGQVCARIIGGERLEFIGAHEASFGAYAMCSLFSPMFEFADHAAARDTAAEVLKVLRSARPGSAPARPSPSSAPASSGVAQPSGEVPAQPSRRAFLTGRVKSNTGAR